MIASARTRSRHLRSDSATASSNVDFCLYFLCIFFAGPFVNVGIELTYAGNKPRVPELTTSRTIRMCGASAKADLPIREPQHSVFQQTSDK
jgi:hypothetical protein